DENGKGIDMRNNFYRSKQITREIERKYGLHEAERKQTGRQEIPDNVIRKVDVAAGNVKKQVGNTVKMINEKYRYLSMNEYRTLLQQYNVTVEEAHGIVNGRKYHGLVYSATDDKGSKVGNPFKSSLYGKSIGYDAIRQKIERSRNEMKERNLGKITQLTVLYALRKTHYKERFIAELKARGIDTIFRYTSDGRIYGTTFIDNRTGCVLNGSRMGKEVSANTLQEHFSLPYENEPPTPITIHETNNTDTTETVSKPEEQSEHIDGLGLLNTDALAVNPEEEAFIRAMQRRKKRKRKGFKL
ncbi:MAG: relaxase, partial [Prevotella sp.]|nr:relaxase [Prevotella sp.]